MRGNLWNKVKIYVITLLSNQGQTIFYTVFSRLRKTYLYGFCRGWGFSVVKTQKLHRSTLSQKKFSFDKSMINCTLRIITPGEPWSGSAAREGDHIFYT